MVPPPKDCALTVAMKTMPFGALKRSLSEEIMSSIFVAMKTMPFGALKQLLRTKRRRADRYRSNEDNALRGTETSSSSAASSVGAEVWVGSNEDNALRGTETKSSYLRLSVFTV